MPPQEDKPVYRGSLTDKAMSECATVECVLELFERYSLAGFDRAQLFFGDATGDAAIIEPLAVVRKQGSYQVATNFYQSQTDPEHRTCWRYKTAVDMLENADQFSVELFRSIVDATHQTGSYPTVYSTLYDLKRGIVYVHYFHGYEDVVEINLSEELEKGEHVYDLPSLFPESDAAEQWAQPKIERFEKKAAQRLATDVAPGVFDAYAGRYEPPAELGLPYDYVSVISDDGRLYIDVPGDVAPRRELFPQSEVSFFYTLYGIDVDFELNFVQDETGRTTQVVFEQGGASVSMNRMDADEVPPTAPPPKATAEPPPGQDGRASWPLWLFGAALVLVGAVTWYGMRRRSRGQ